jgi:hypothetical protein
MKESFEELFSKYPEIITSSMWMDKPNESIFIYEGNFDLTTDNLVLKMNGSIYFNWFPYPQVKFKGLTTNTLKLDTVFQNLFEKYQLIIDGILFGEAFVSSSSPGKETFLEGTVLKNVILGDRSIPVTKIRFTVPNLREFFGDTVRSLSQKGSPQISRSRLEFKKGNIKIIIDKSFNFKELYESLSAQGGYILLYAGEIIKSRGSITSMEISDLIHCFSVFLSFLNGRRCSPLFLQGICDNEVKWTDFSSNKVDIYKDVYSWPQSTSIEGLSALWNNFFPLWRDSNNKDFINTAIHWYIEGNSNSGLIEGSIIMIQTGLELIYNWFVIEQKKILIGDDSYNICAANKIRLILTQINVGYEVPDGLTNLKHFVQTKKLGDAVEAFVFIRNCIVHSQEEKRKRLLNIENIIKYEVRELGLWYIELSILYILNYDGKYTSRCSAKKWASESETLVPWKKTGNNP